MSEDELYNPIWPFYEPLYSFLKDVYECRSSINTEDNSASQSTYTEEQTSTDIDLESPVAVANSYSKIVPETSSNSETNKIKVPVVKRRAKDSPELAEASREMSKAFTALNQAPDKKNCQIR
ncbi:uncharacterized protein LOC126739643 [Anthonomus grandis grandis]|uniref:uncharacterized protein LOC126739643 n=1 Tax=Anthonomus grandis grandis TaxID=2921223 RepID=UPI0021667E64|nr:uncharacterized protein LOC126739643 [Anthonomus grandis grandis]